MAGTLVIDTLTDGSGNSTSATNAIRGSAKAWVRFAGATAAISASLNVSSVTRLSTGRYQVNFSTAFSDTSYAFAGAASCDGTFGVAGAVRILKPEQASTYLVGSCVIGSVTTSTNQMSDAAIISAAFYR